MRGGCQNPKHFNTAVTPNAVIAPTAADALIVENIVVYAAPAAVNPINPVVTTATPVVPTVSSFAFAFAAVPIDPISTSPATNAFSFANTPPNAAAPAANPISPRLPAILYANPPNAADATVAPIPLAAILTAVPTVSSSAATGAAVAIAAPTAVPTVIIGADNSDISFIYSEA